MIIVLFCSVTQLCPTLWPMDCRLPCASPPPGVDSNPCLLSQWYHPTTSSSIAPFSSCLQSFPASEPFKMSQLFASGGQSVGVSASVFPMNIQDWFLFRLTGWISLQSKGLQESSPTPQFEASILQRSAFTMVQLSHLYMTTGKSIALTRWTFVGKVTSLLFNTLSRFIIDFTPRSKHLLISWLQSLSTVIFEPK